VYWEKRVPEDIIQEEIAYWERLGAMREEGTKSNVVPGEK